MKKLTKVASTILAFAISLQGIPVTVGAAEVSSGVIDFTEDDDYNITTSYNDYLNVLWGNMYVKDNAAVTYGRSSSGNGNTMNFSVNAGKLSPVKDNGGVITYKFKYKWENVTGIPGIIAIKLGADGCIDLNTSYSDTNPDGYFGIAVLDYNKGMYISYNGTSQSAGDKWDTPQSAWTDDYCEIQIKVDLYGKRLGFKEADGNWYWVSMASTSKYPLKNYWQMGLRGTMGVKSGDAFTKEANFYVDDVSVSYTTEPAEIDTDVIDFENGSLPGMITAMWSSGTAEIADDPTNVGYNSALKISSPTTRNAGIKFNLSDWAGAGAGMGSITYEFDVYTNGNNITFATNDANDNERLGILCDAYLGLWASKGTGPLTQFKTDVRASEWQNVKLVLDRKNETVAVTLNGNEQGTTSYTKNGTKDYILALKGTNPISGATSVDFYIDNLRAYYSENIPDVGEAAHTWLGGIELPFTVAMDKQSVEEGITLRDASTYTTISSEVNYNEVTCIATITPTEALDPNASYILTVSDDVKTADGIYISDTVERNVTLETLVTPEIGDDDVSIFDRNGTELISKVKIIKAMFNVPMDKASLEAEGNITLVKENGDTPIALAVEYDMNNGNAVTLTLDEELESNSTYLLTFGTNVKRIDGTALAEPIVKTITTPILEKPAIITDDVTYVDKSGVTGRMNSIKKKITKINVPFTISLDSSTVNNGNISLVKLTGDESPIALNASYVGDDKTVLIVPNTPLDAQCEYKLTFSENVKGINGEKIESGKNGFTFETAVLDTPKAVSVTASADGLNYAEVAGVADITTVKTEFNYALNPTTISADTVKLEKYVSGSWTDAGAAFAFDGNKCVTWTLASGWTFPEGVNFRISFSSAVEDIYGDKPTEDYEVTFVTKQSASVNGLKSSILGKSLTYSGTLLSGSEPVANEKMSVLIYKQGGSPVPFGADTRHFDIITTGEDGSFGGSILLYDDESTPLFEELWLAFDAQSMGKSNQRDARVAVQYTNTLMDEASVADLKGSSKQVFSYITEAADSDDIKAIVPPSGLTAIRNKKLYEGMGVWVSKYTAMTDEEKTAVNTSLDSYKTQLTTKNISKILNASLIAVDFISLGTNDAVADLITYSDNIEAISVEGTDFSELSAESQIWIAENVKANNPSGFASYEVFIKEVRKSMLLDMVSSTTYTALADLFINNKELVNDGLSENKLAGLENEKSQKVTDAAMRSIKLLNGQSKFKTTAALADAIKLAVQNAKNSGTQGGGPSSSGNDGFSIGTGASSPSQNNGNGSFGNGGTASNVVFNDLSDYKWAETAILNLYNKGVISGMGNGTFEPERGVKREEFLKMVCGAFGFDASDSPVGFEDVASDEWYTKYVASAVRLGIVRGVSDTHFGTGSLISREDMAVMIFRALEASGRNIPSDRKKFNDANEISAYALEAVETLCSMGIISGVGDGIFAPKNTATRAEAAVIISRCLQ